MDRRDFLRMAGAVAVMAPFAMRAARVRAAHPAHAIGDRVLVLVELAGGNDGLNTVIPYSDPRYYDLRPGLAIARDQVVRLSERLGLHPALEPLLDTWRDRRLAVVNGVGYPEPNRSHFRSIEIWETASDSGEYRRQGWVAQLFADRPEIATGVADGVVLGQGRAGPLQGEGMRTIVMRQPDTFFSQARRLQPRSMAAANPALAHILKVQQDVVAAAAGIEAGLVRDFPYAEQFPRSRIGFQLRQAAQLIASHIHVPVIKVTHGSFDTHSNQRDRHEQLLKQLAAALRVFRDSLQAGGSWDHVLVMTYSEFGRRAAENGSRGTDHGTAAPQFFMGGRVRGGLYGPQPSLASLAGGDLRHHVDYRSLYTTVMQRWWEMSDDSLPVSRFPVIDCIA